MMVRRLLDSLAVASLLLFSAPALAQWNPNNPIENAPAKDKIPPYVQHATYTASKAPIPGPIEVGYNFHLPPGYDAGSERYPVIYQLGGNTDNESIGLVDRGLPNRYQEKMEDGTIRPVISIYVNGPGTLPSYALLEPTVIDELIPHIDSKFRTLTAPACRHIEGYSRGGSGAPLFAFKHPGLFRATVSNAGSATEGINEALPDLKAAALAVDMRLRVTILEGDHLFEANQDFREFLDDQAIPYDYASAPGGSHDTNKYFNDPATYEPIGYGNIIWHENAFAEHGCDADGGMGGAGGIGGVAGTAGAGGLGGSGGGNPADRGSSAVGGTGGSDIGSTVAGTMSMLSAGADGMGETGAMAAHAPPDAGSGCACRLQWGSARDASWAPFGVLLLFAVRRRRARRCTQQMFHAPAFEVLVMHPLPNVALAVAILSAVIGCGGSNPPPPDAPAAEPPPAETPASPPSGDGQHTMPDGSTMPGEQHGHDHEHQK